MLLENNEKLLFHFIERDLFEFAINLCRKHFTMDIIIEMNKYSEDINLKKIIKISFNSVRKKIETPLYSWDINHGK